MAAQVEPLANNYATYEEVKDLPNQSEVLLIDVREPKELIDTGTIPTSINIPLNDIELVFSNKTTTEIFKNIYGREKPNSQTLIIVTCRSGTRAQIGVDKLVNLGFEKVKNYKGSWLEWSKREDIAKSEI